MSTIETAARFITVEGPEGAGKSTQVARLAERLTDLGLTVTVTREPGGTAVGEAVRAVLLSPIGAEPLPLTEALLFCAARAEVVAHIVRPALAAGETVLCDRFSDSTLAYQGYGRGVSLDWLRSVIAGATGGLVPDLTLVLDLPVEIGLARRRGEGGWNRLDAADVAFHRRVRDGFLALAHDAPERLVIIPADGAFERVAAAIWDAVAARIAGVP